MERLFTTPRSSLFNSSQGNMARESSSGHEAPSLPAFGKAFDASSVDDKSLMRPGKIGQMGNSHKSGDVGERLPSDLVFTN